MTLEELQHRQPLTFKEVKSVEDINSIISLKSTTLGRDFDFYKYLAAHHGGIYDWKHKKFRSHFEYDPQTRTLKPVRIRMTHQDKERITENSIIRSRDKEYYSAWHRSTIELQLQRENKL